MIYYNSLNDELKKRFGCKVYKLSVDGGFTCPNRDGKIDTGGCIFCSGRGSGDFAPTGCSLREKVNRAKALVESKNKGGKYILYFQSFTNTYAPVSRLREIFEEAVSLPEISGLAIATRPDCLEQEKIELLSELNSVKPLWVELGLQTVNEHTAKYIRRGYPLSAYDDAVRRLKAANIETVTHMIIGLPGETADDAVKTAKYISDIGSDGIKLQLLHILKGTDLAGEYDRGNVLPLSLSEYIDILEACVSVLRDDIIVHRLTGDGAKRDLIAPVWSGDKKRVLNEIRKRMLPRSEMK